MLRLAVLDSLLIGAGIVLSARLGNWGIAWAFVIMVASSGTR